MEAHTHPDTHSPHECMHTHECMHLYTRQTPQTHTFYTQLPLVSMHQSVLLFSNADKIFRLSETMNYFPCQLQM